MSTIPMFQGIRRTDGSSGNGARLQMGTAVIGDTDYIGGTCVVKYRVCLCYDEVDKTLEVSQSQVPEKKRFLDNQSLTDYTTCIVVYAKHPVATVTATDVSLRPEVSPPVNPSLATDFIRRHGTSYVTSQTVGGEYIALYTFYTADAWQQNKLLSEMKAAGIVSSLRIHPSLQPKINGFQTTLDVRTTFQHCVSGVDPPVLPAYDKVLSYALTFPAQVLANPVVIAVNTAGYECCPGVDSVTFARASGFRIDAVVADLRRSAVRVGRLLSIVEKISGVYRFYGGFDQDLKLNKVQAQAVNDLKVLQSAISAVSTDPFGTIPEAPLVLESLKHGVPRLRVSPLQHSPEQHGGDVAGTPFCCDISDDGVVRFLEQHTRIAALEMFRSPVEEVVSGVAVTYSSHANPRWKVQHGAEPVGKNIAASRGALSPHRSTTGAEYSGKKLVVPAGEFVTSMTGYYHDGVITNLELTLSNGESISEGASSVNGFLWKLPAHSVIIGFKGRYMSLLTSVQVVYTTLLPAFWDESPSSC